MIAICHQNFPQNRLVSPSPAIGKAGSTRLQKPNPRLNPRHSFLLPLRKNPNQRSVLQNLSSAPLSPLPLMALHLTRPKHRSLINPSLIHLFSTSSSPPNDPNVENDSHTNGSNEDSNPSLTKYFSDVKANLREKQGRPTSRFPRNPTNNHVPSSSPVGSISYIEEIRKNLSEFRNRSAVPPPDKSVPPASQSQPHISFQELFKRNVMAKSEGPNPNAIDSGATKGARLSFEAIRESLKNMRPSTGASNVGMKGGQQLPSAFSGRLRMTTPESSARSTLIGGTDNLPLSVFGKEMSKGESDVSDGAAMNTEFVKLYTYQELGEKLRMLRPEGKEGRGEVEGWFSLQELNERLMKLREMEEKEISQIGGISFKDLKSSLITMKLSNDEKGKKSSSKFTA